MGMSIEEHIIQLKKLKSFHNGSYGANINFAIDTMRKYQMMQADYEARLKADMVAMLTELQLEIEELYPEHQCSGELAGFAEAIETITPVIQQKINKLKEKENKD